MRSTKRKTLKEFIAQSRIVHGGRYDYSLVVYKNNKTKVKIICPTHGVFEQSPNSHMDGSGCIKCANVEKYDNKTFIELSQKRWGSLYDYSHVIYNGAHTHVIIGCKKHGWFEKMPYVHLQGQGCPICGRDRTKNTQDEFIARSRVVHGNKYSYKKVKYINTYTKVEIMCPIHGVFLQTPDSHTRRKHGCPLCATPKGEAKIIKYLLEKNIEFKSQKIFKTTPPYNRLRFDFFLPFFNILIEFNGRQHYEAIDFFKHNRSFEYQQDIDKRKTEFATINKINLITIPYWDFERIQEILDTQLFLMPSAR
jgi:hypothetical protein